MRNRTPHPLTAALSIGTILLLGAGCSAGEEAPSAGTAGTIATAGGTGVDGTTVRGPGGDGTTGVDGTQGSTVGAAGTAESTDLDQVAITVHYAGTHPVSASEFVRPMPNFVLTRRGKVVDTTGGDGVTEGSVSPSAVRDLLDRAGELGLLDGQDLPPGELAPDGPYAKVTIADDSGSATLETQTLTSSESDPRRKALYEFISEATEVAGAAADPEPYRPVSYLFKATPITSGAGTSTGTTADETRQWPVDLVSPADAADCAEITANSWGGPMTTDGAQLYVDDGQAYSVTAIPALPGQAC